MSNLNALINIELVRTAYQAYARGDVDTMLDFMAPDMEWTYLDPSLEGAEPQICYGRQELESVIRVWAERGLQAELEEIAGDSERVMVGVRIPGIGAYMGRPGQDQVYNVLTVRDGRIIALRDCRDRQEALRVAGLG